LPYFRQQKKEAENFIDELKGFHAQFYDCFSGSEPRENLFRYTSGQFSNLERKSIEPIALNIQGGEVRSMQRFVSDVVWDESKLLYKYHRIVNEDMGDSNGVLIFDESGFVKKGNDSAGVAKQYCGNLGKVENCQVGVFAAYASPSGYALLDKRLSIPEKWFNDDYGKRRDKCKIPKDVGLKTKPELAVEMLHDLQDRKVIPYRYVLADSLYGNSPEFIDAIEKYANLTYFTGIPYRHVMLVKKTDYRKEAIQLQKQSAYKGGS